MLCNDQEERYGVRSGCGGNCLPRTSPTWKRFFLAQWLYVSVPLPAGTAHPLPSPTLYTAGSDEAGDTEAARRMQQQAAAARTTTLAIGVHRRRISKGTSV